MYDVDDDDYNNNDDHYYHRTIIMIFNRIDVVFISAIIPPPQPFAAVLLSSNEMVKDQRIPLLSFTGSNAVSYALLNVKYLLTYFGCNIRVNVSHTFVRS